MIRHILKIIWNERRHNLWLMAEFLLAFVVLWFCADYLYLTYTTRLVKSGIDIEHTYSLALGQKALKIVDGKPEKVDNYAITLTLLDRLQRHPDVESAVVGNYLPYLFSSSSNSTNVNGDTTQHYSYTERVATSGYFDVFRIPIRSGTPFEWTDQGARNHVVISPYIGDRFGNYYSYYEPVSEIRELGYPSYDKRPAMTVVAVTEPIFYSILSSQPESSVIKPIGRGQFNLTNGGVVIRVRPEADGKDFAERFTREMRQQLNIGPYYLMTMTPMKENKKRSESHITGGLIDAYTIAGFIIVNIFLGILGTFWFRTQSRRGDIGLRMALGSPRRKVIGLIVGETLMLLLAAAVAGTVICLNLAKIGLMKELRFLYVSREDWGVGWEQDVINFALTFGFLAIVSVVAVWYPARQAARTQPAEALHEE